MLRGTDASPGASSDRRAGLCVVRERRPEHQQGSGHAEQEGRHGDRLRRVGKGAVRTSYGPHSRGTTVPSHPCLSPRGNAVADQSGDDQRLVCDRPHAQDARGTQRPTTRCRDSPSRRGGAARRRAASAGPGRSAANHGTCALSEPAQPAAVSRRPSESTGASTDLVTPMRARLKHGRRASRHHASTYHRWPEGERSNPMRSYTACPMGVECSPTMGLPSSKAALATATVHRVPSPRRAKHGRVPTQ